MWSVPPPTLEVAAKDCGFSMSEIGYTEQEDESFFSELLSSGAKGSDEKDSTVIHLFSLNPADLSYPKLPTWLAKHLEDPSLRGQFTADHLQKALHRARLIKTEQEIGFIREACKITSIAHEVVMRELGKFARKRDVSQAQGQTQSDAKKKRSGKEGLGEWEIESEADAEAVFVASCRRFGCVILAFQSIGTESKN
jgi:Xaa-Pro dipeptidase